MGKPVAEPLGVRIRRWPDREARFELSRPTRRPPLNFGLSLEELLELGDLADAARAIVAEEPLVAAYEVGDLKAMKKARAA